MDFKQKIAQVLEELTHTQDLYAAMEVPPTTDLGDFAFPCFRLAKVLRKAPAAIAKELAEKWEQSVGAAIAKATVTGGYLNFFVHKDIFAKEVLEGVLSQKERYGSDTLGEGKVICLDYSSVNIAKKFHIGHLSSTAIGAALKNMYTHLGYRCVSINHLGDWGTQFGKMICAYKHWGEQEKVEKEGIDELMRLYVRFDAEATPALEEEAREWFHRMEENDGEAMEIFTRFKELTLKDAAKVYELMGITFDDYTGESFYYDKWQGVVQELRDKKLLTESNGAQVVDLTPYDMPPCLILKSDGASLYSTRDIAAALYRKKTYGFDKCLYVVAYQQNLHFQQWFKVVEMMGYPWHKDLEHVAFGMVSYEGKTLHTRKGHVVYLEDVLNRSVEKAYQIICEKNPELPDKEKVAKEVGIGAVIFYDLYNNRMKDVDFWWDRALNFDGETGPYVQYTHARCCSVLQKAGDTAWEGIDFGVLSEPQAQDVLRYMEKFPALLKEAAQKNEPSLLTRFSVDLAQKFNKFYYDLRILTEDEAVSKARLALCYATRTLLKITLGLIGIAAPVKM